MTDVHDIVAAVEASPEFDAFNAKNPHHYLVHAFATISGAAAPLELGYYGKESDTITVFKTNPIHALPPDEVFKEGGTLKQLDLATVRLGLNEAIARAEKERAAAYPHHATMKMICVLQQAEVATWNMTIVTNTMQMINMKFDALTGLLLSRSMHSLMDLAQDR